MISSLANMLSNAESFFDEDESQDAPPQPSRSTLFVLRNGRYEPQNLWPVMPRSDFTDFDGFVVRRGGAPTRQPPELRQAGLVKNPVSLRRDSVSLQYSGPLEKEFNVGQMVRMKDFSQPLWKTGTVTSLDPLKVRLQAQADGETGHMWDVVENWPKADVNFCDDTVEGAAKQKELFVFNCTIDALQPLTLSLHVLATELEEWDGDRLAHFELVMQGSSIDSPHDAPLAPAIETRHLEAGLGQVFRSDALDLSSYWPAELTYNASFPKDIPIAVRLESQPEDGENPVVQYTYISLSAGQGQWSTKVFAQKLRYAGRCFVLHDLFGVGGKIADNVPAEAGGAECIICMAEPRDTAVLPCRHMCFCHHCAGIVRLRCEKCPVCRQKVAKLLQFKRDEKPLNPPLLPLANTGITKEVAAEKPSMVTMPIAG